MLATTTPALYSFLKNPIVFEFTTDSNTIVVFTVAFSGQQFLISVVPFKINDTTYKLSFDISDLFANQVPVYDATLSFQINLAGFVLSYTVTTTDYSFTSNVIPGGLSREYQKFLAHQNTNAFNYRFLNPLANWLFTTRTDSSVINMTRKELACMFFLTPTSQNVSVETDNGDVLSLGTATLGTPCMVNLPVWLASLNSGQVSVIYFCVAELKVIKINIVDKFSEDSYLIKFRNSLGVFEFIEISGKATRTPVYPDDAGYNVFDSDLQEFKKARLRVNASNVINVETGYKSTDDLYFIGDLLSAGSSWFISGLKKQKCLVTSGNYTHALKQTTPESITLKIEPVSSEKHYSPMNDINTIYEILATEDDEYIITDDNFMI